MNDTALAKYSNPSLEQVLQSEDLFYRTFRPIGGQPAIDASHYLAAELKAMMPFWENGPGYVVFNFDNWRDFRLTALGNLQNPRSTAIQPRATEPRLTAPPQAPPIELAHLIQQSLSPRSGGSQPTININISGSFNTTTTETNSRNYTSSRQLRYHQEETRRVIQTKPSAVVAPFFFFLWLFAMMALIVGGGSNNGR